MEVLGIGLTNEISTVTLLFGSTVAELLCFQVPRDMLIIYSRTGGQRQMKFCGIFTLNLSILYNIVKFCVFYYCCLIIFYSKINEK